MTVCERERDPHITLPPDCLCVLLGLSALQAFNSDDEADDF